MRSLASRIAIAGLFTTSVSGALLAAAQPASAASYSMLVSTSSSRANPVALDGTTDSGSIYVFVTPTSGVTKVDFSIDGTFFHSEGAAPMDLNGGTASAAAPYSTSALADGSHTISAAVTDSGGVTTLTSAFTVANSTAPPSGTDVTVSSPDDAALGLPSTRLLFSTVGSAATPARSFTLQNTTQRDINISALAFSGPNAADYALAPGQPTSLFLGAGQSTAVSMVFTPSPSSSCAAGSTTGTYERYAALTFSTDDPAQPSGSAGVAGLNPCKVEGGNEPDADQVVRALGYSTKMHTVSADQRSLGALRTPSSADEVISPYFVRADTGQPVRFTTAARYEGRYVYQEPSGRYAKGSGTGTPSCSGCETMFKHAADTSTAYVENQKLMPGIVSGGSNTFTPSGSFGLWEGSGQPINYSDDGKNYAQDSKGNAITSPGTIYLHNFRVFQAYAGSPRVLLPNTYLVLDDIGRISANHNYDYQDYVYVLRNARPELDPSPRTATSSTLSSGGTVNGDCSVAVNGGTGFDGALASSNATACNPANVAFTGTGLQITSTSGEMGGTKNAQQNALYDTFNATTKAFTVRARVQGPIDYLSQNFQQVAAWFGPDQDNYVKVEAEHNNDDQPHLSMFFEEKGTGTVIGSVALPGLTSASTVDLIIKGNTSVANPDSTYGAKGEPLGELTVYYALDGGTPVQVGTVKRPADVLRWFSTQAKAGILTSGGGSGTAISPVFTSFSVAAG